jgi:hypothetical protein
MIKLIRTMISSLLIFILPNANSFEVRIREHRTVHVYQNNKDILIPQQVLPAGTTVNIPDEYFNNNFKGNKKDDAAVMKWLASYKSVPISKFQNGEKISNEYFVKISVPGSNDVGWITLRGLAKKKKLKIYTTEDTSLYKTLNDDGPEQSVVENQQQDPKSLKCKLPNILNHLEGGNIVELQEMTFEILDELEKEINKGTAKNKLNKGNIQGIISNFNNSCSPIKFADFYQKLKIISIDESIPTEILLGLMTQETAGRCNANLQEDNNTTSIGLFQINSRSAKINYCKSSPDTAETRRIHFLNESCLQNPIANLKESIRVLKNKYSIINGGTDKLNNRKLFINLTPIEKAQWRKTLAAYNGGQAYVTQAYADIRLFNSTHNTAYDTNDWPTVKTFMLRRAIELRGGQIFNEESGYKNKRTSKNTIHNLTYVDSILPEYDTPEELTNETPQTKLNQAIKWQQYIEEN